MFGIQLYSAGLIGILVVSAAVGPERAPQAPGSSDALQVIILGAPGAGKGTQAAKISQEFRIPHISTGDILRAEVARGTELGKQVEGVMKRGELVADDVVLGLVRKRLQDPDCAGGFILDGFPRTIPQAEGLDKILNTRPSRNVRVLNLAVPDPVLMKRLLGRGRADDTEESIKNRLRLYHIETAPLIEYYRGRGVLLDIDGDRSIEGVFEKIGEVLRARKS